MQFLTNHARRTLARCLTVIMVLSLFAGISFNEAKQAKATTSGLVATVYMWDDEFEPIQVDTEEWGETQLMEEHLGDIEMFSLTYDGEVVSDPSAVKIYDVQDETELTGIATITTVNSSTTDALEAAVCATAGDTTVFKMEFTEDTTKIGDYYIGYTPESGDTVYRKFNLGGNGFSGTIDLEGGDTWEFSDQTQNNFELGQEYTATLKYMGTPITDISRLSIKKTNSNGDYVDADTHATITCNTDGTDGKYKIKFGTQEITRWQDAVDGSNTEEGVYALCYHDGNDEDQFIPANVYAHLSLVGYPAYEGGVFIDPWGGSSLDDRTDCFTDNAVVTVGSSKNLYMWTCVSSPLLNIAEDQEHHEYWYNNGFHQFWLGSNPASVLDTADLSHEPFHFYEYRRNRYGYEVAYEDTEVTDAITVTYNAELNRTARNNGSSVAYGEGTANPSYAPFWTFTFNRAGKYAMSYGDTRKNQEWITINVVEPSSGGGGDYGGGSGGTPTAPPTSAPTPVPPVDPTTPSAKPLDPTVDKIEPPTAAVKGDPETNTSTGKDGSKIESTKTEYEDGSTMVVSITTGKDGSVSEKTVLTKNDGSKITSETKTADDGTLTESYSTSDSEGKNKETKTIVTATTGEKTITEAAETTTGTGKNKKTTENAVSEKLNADGKVESRTESTKNTDKKGVFNKESTTTDADGNKTITKEKGKKDKVTSSSEYAVDKDNPSEVKLTSVKGKSLDLSKKITANGTEYKVTSIGGDALPAKGKVKTLVIDAKTLESIDPGALLNLNKNGLVKIKGTKKECREAIKMIQESGLPRGNKIKFSGKGLDKGKGAYQTKKK